eukprot:jgi/Mesen1/10774/ME000091S10307
MQSSWVAGADRPLLPVSQQRPLGPRRGRPARFLRSPRGLPFRSRFQNFVVLVLLLALAFSLFAAWRLLSSQGLEEGDEKDAKASAERRHEAPAAKKRDATQAQARGGVSAELCKHLETPPWVCAHGGDSSRAPPNTVAAYQRALAAGVECVEVDASRTADGVLVALHDRELQIFSGRPGLRVGDLTLAQVQELDAGRGFPAEYAGERVPTLLEALTMLGSKVRQLTVDVKVGPSDSESLLASQVLAAIRAADCASCMVWAKSDAIVSTLNLLEPRLKTGYIVMREKETGQVSELLRLEAPHVVGVFWGLVTPALMAAARRAGREVHVWTVDQEDVMRLMLELGVSAIVTSQPELLQATIRKFAGDCRGSGDAN